MRNEAESTTDRLILITTPGTKRAFAIADAARRVGFQLVQVLSYVDALSASLKDVPKGCLVRFDSPSGCPETARKFLAAGIDAMEAEGAVPIRESEIAELAFERGEILHPRQWFFGFRAVIRQIADRWNERNILWTSDPESIVTAFDKLECLDRWSAEGLPVPQRYPTIRTYHQLRDSIPKRHARLFLKLRYGYSAMGAVALEWRDSRVRAITTVDVTWSQGRPRLFVTKQPQVIQNEFAVSWLIDTLAMEEILVEEWIPKVRWQGVPYDLRVVMIQGRMQHVIGRANSSPFTNLNLDGRRVPRDVIERQLGDTFELVESCCERACSLLPGAEALGMDVLVRPCRQRIALLEANAFGDYLPGLLHAGRSTYEAELLSCRDDVMKEAGV